MSRDTFRYESLRTRAKVTVTIFALIVFLSMVAVLSGLAEMSLLQRALSGATIAMQEADISDQRQAGIGLLQAVVSVTAAVFFLMWFYRAHKNLEAVNVHGLKYSARWAVGSFFVPILNLFRPFQIARETWKASAADDTQGGDWRNAKTPVFLKWWWALFLIQNALTQSALRVYRNADDQLELLAAGSSLMVVSDLLAIPAAALAMLFVRRVTKHQRRMTATPPVPAGTGF